MFGKDPVTWPFTTRTGAPVGWSYLTRVSSAKALAFKRLESDAMPETDVQIEEHLRILRELMPMYAVILHNDDIHPMEYVIGALLKSVASLTRDRAEDIMLEAHSKGRAVVIVCPLEQAELYRDRIKSFSLTCTIEKV